MAGRLGAVDRNLASITGAGSEFRQLSSRVEFEVGTQVCVFVAAHLPLCTRKHSDVPGLLSAPRGARSSWARTGSPGLRDAKPGLSRSHTNYRELNPVARAVADGRVCATSGSAATHMGRTRRVAHVPFRQSRRASRGTPLARELLSSPGAVVKSRCSHPRNNKSSLLPI